MLLREFLDANSHRSYPFDQPNIVPESLIAHMMLLVSGNIDTGSLFINKIVTGSSVLKVYFACTSSGQTVQLGAGAVIALTPELNVQYPVFAKSDASGCLVEGTIVIGNPQAASDMPPVTDLTYAEGKIFPGIILPVNNWCTGLQVNGRIYTGLVTLELGAGLALDVIEDTDTDTTSLTIYSPGAAAPPDNSIIVSDEALLNNIIARYGVPITHINGVSASDEEGNFTIEAGADGCLDITPVTGGIIIRDTCNVPCCTKQDIYTLLDSIGALNDRAGTMYDFQLSLETALNTLSSQVARLG